MATLSKLGITNGSTIQPSHVTQSVDAFTGLASYDITLSGSLTLTGSLNQSGSIRVSNAVTASSFTGSFTGSFSGSHFGTASLTGSFTGSFVGPLAGTASGANFINNSPTPSYLPSGSIGVNFLNGAFGVLAGSIKLGSGVSAVINPAALSGKKFQTQYWVTATKASGSTSPGNNALMVESLNPPVNDTFIIRDIASSTNDDVNFIVVYIQ
jgi:hypothetical protein